MAKQYNRYFDIAEDRLTMQLQVSEQGKEYTVEQIEQKLKITGLREIGKPEFDKLTKEYTSNAI